MIFSHLNQPSSLVFNLQEIAPLNDLPRNSTTNHKTTGTAHLLRPASLATITRRGMKTFTLILSSVVSKQVALESLNVIISVNRCYTLPHFQKTFSESPVGLELASSSNFKHLDLSVTSSDFNALASIKSHNDLQGRFFELVHAHLRSDHYANTINKLHGDDPKKGWEVIGRSAKGIASILSKKYGGDYGFKKIDSVDVENDWILTMCYGGISQYRSALITEVKTSSIGALSDALKSASSDVNFNKSSENLSVYLEKQYGLKNIEPVLIKKAFAYYGSQPPAIPSDIEDSLIVNAIIENYSKQISFLAQKGVVTFEFNFFFGDNNFPAPGNLLNLFSDDSLSFDATA